MTTRSNKASKRSALAVMVSAMALTLSGCGEDDEIPQQLDEFQVSAQSAEQVVDNAQHDIELNELLEAPEHEVAIMGGDGLSATGEDGKLRLEVANLDRPGSAQILIRDATGESEPVLLRVALDNESGRPIEERAEAWRDHHRELKQAREFDRLYRMEMDLAYALGELDDQQRSERLTSWQQELDELGDELTQTLAQFETALTLYRRGEIGQQSLKGSLDEAASQYDDQTESLRESINEARQQLTDRDPLSLHATSYDEASGGVSALVGNEQLGTHVEGDWRFDDQHEHLARVSNATQADFCEQERY